MGAEVKGADRPVGGRGWEDTAARRKAAAACQSIGGIDSGSGKTARILLLRSLVQYNRPNKAHRGNPSLTTKSKPSICCIDSALSLSPPCLFRGPLHPPVLAAHSSAPSQRLLPRLYLSPPSAPSRSCLKSLELATLPAPAWQKPWCRIIIVFTQS